MMEIYLASGNAHKLEELRAALAPAGGRVHGPGEAGGMPEVEETGTSFEENALLKARALAERLPSGACALADDSGLAVDALNGAPGVRSARYAGESARDAANNARLLKELAGRPRGERGARFVCVLALVERDGGEWTFRGECPGRVLGEPRGEQGFGYDPLFVPEAGDGRTFAEMSAGEKQALSHRGRAVQELSTWVSRVWGA